MSSENKVPDLEELQAQLSGLSNESGFIFLKGVIAFDCFRNTNSRSKCPSTADASEETVAVTRGPGRRIKGWPFVHIPYYSPASFSLPSFNLHPLSWTWIPASDCNGAQATWACRLWEVDDSPVHFVVFPALRHSPDPALAYHTRPHFCMRALHMTGGYLSLSSVVGE